jgi:hypothetical protein
LATRDYFGVRAFSRMDFDYEGGGDEGGGDEGGGDGSEGEYGDEGGDDEGDNGDPDGGSDDDGADWGDESAPPGEHEPVNGDNVAEWAHMSHEGGEWTVGTEYSPDGDFGRTVAKDNDGPWEADGPWMEVGDEPDEGGGESAHDPEEQSDGPAEQPGPEPGSEPGGGEASVPPEGLQSPGETPPDHEGAGNPGQPPGNNLPPSSVPAPPGSGNGSGPTGSAGLQLIDDLLKGLFDSHGGTLSPLRAPLSSPFAAAPAGTIGGGGGPTNGASPGQAGAFVVDDPQQYVGDEVSKWDTQCVRLVQMVMQKQGKPMGPTNSWSPTTHVSPGASIPRGAVIATFVNGKYPQGKTAKHAAIFIEKVPGGIRVVDQNLPKKYGSKVGSRIIKFNNEAGGRQNNADDYWVVGSEP